MNLNWIDVDPDLYNYDPDTAMEIVENVIKSSPTEGPLWKGTIENEINQSFIQAFGKWASGWRFSRGGHNGCGGVIKEWCCPEHSIVIENDQVNMQATADHAVNALAEWQKHLKHLKQLFLQFPLSLLDKKSSARDINNACTRIIYYVIIATDAEDAWHNYAERVLSWYLEFMGIEVDEANQIAAKVSTGKFENWVKPDKEIINNIAHDYARDTLAQIAF